MFTGIWRVGILIVLMITLFTGCGNSIKDDMLNYNNRFKDLLDEVADISKQIEAGQGQEDFKKNMKKSVIPKLKKVKTKAENIKPQTEEVRQLKSLFIDCITLNLEGCNTVLKAIDTSNADTFQKAKDQFDHGQTLEEEFRNKWDELAEKQGIDIK